MAVPNYINIVKEAVERWKEDWRVAHTNHPQSEQWIKKLASWLHYEVDDRIGLNGKRGTNELSDDVLNFLDHDDPSGQSVDVASGKRCMVIDVIGSAGWVPGEREPYPTWNEVWDPNQMPTRSKWIKPERVHDQGGAVEPKPTMPSPTLPTPTKCNFQPIDFTGLIAALNALGGELAKMAADVEAAKHDAKVAAETALVIKAALVEPLQLDGRLSGIFGGKITGNVTATIKK